MHNAVAASHFALCSDVYDADGVAVCQRAFAKFVDHVVGDAADFIKQDDDKEDDVGEQSVADMRAAVCADLLVSQYSSLVVPADGAHGDAIHQLWDAIKNTASVRSIAGHRTLQLRAVCINATPMAILEKHKTNPPVFTFANPANLHQQIECSPNFEDDGSMVQKQAVVLALTMCKFTHAPIAIDSKLLYTPRPNDVALVSAQVDATGTDANEEALRRLWDPAAAADPERDPVAWETPAWTKSGKSDSVPTKRATFTPMKMGHIHEWSAHAMKDDFLPDDDEAARTWTNVTMTPMQACFVNTAVPWRPVQETSVAPQMWFLLDKVATDAAVDDAFARFVRNDAAVMSAEKWFVERSVWATLKSVYDDDQFVRPNVSEKPAEVVYDVDRVQMAIASGSMLALVEANNHLADQLCNALPRALALIVQNTVL
jgi:hypothetical protein